VNQQQPIIFKQTRISQKRFELARSYKTEPCLVNHNNSWWNRDWWIERTTSMENCWIIIISMKLVDAVPFYSIVGPSWSQKEFHGEWNNEENTWALDSLHRYDKASISDKHCLSVSYLHSTHSIFCFSTRIHFSSQTIKSYSFNHSNKDEQIVSIV
jgi:hypothetical protein